MNSVILYIYRLITYVLPETRFFSLKRFLLRKAGLVIGENVRICSSALFLGTGKIYIGDNTWIGHNVIIASASPSEICIGDNVDIAPNVYIGNGSHEIDPLGSHSAGKGISGNIIINDGVWICVNSTILANVEIGHKAVVGACTLVNKNIEAYTVVGGNPCKEIKKII